ncbi:MULTISPECIES: P27 family phage terminase small subunit [unclassified Flavobacterium]|uniref:P27 family phage terminase small subunit n=1 Tax=Flavobacterium sp. ASV13 TaxID=1506583 RepID=UPI00055474B7|nr:P27 family phage terminase small subunit [Flavobacterium sp. ASV13]
MDNLEVVSIGKGKDTLMQVPTPPKYLTDSAKKHYKFMGNVLAKNDRMKETYLNALEIYAEAMAQFQFALERMKEKNKKEFGTGYIQTFKSGASNISVELTLKNDAADTLMKCFKLFGLDPKSDKELKLTGDPAQTDLFDAFLKASHG